MKKKGVSFIPIRREEVVQTNFAEQMVRGVHGSREGRYTNHALQESNHGENDLTIMVFDNRTLNATFERADTSMGRRMKLLLKERK